MRDFAISSDELPAAVLFDCEKTLSALRNMGVIERSPDDAKDLAEPILEAMRAMDGRCCALRWGTPGPATSNRRAALRNCVKRHRLSAWTRRTVCRAIRGNADPEGSLQVGQHEGYMVLPHLRMKYGLIIDRVAVRECAACTVWRKTKLPEVKADLKRCRDSGESLTPAELTILGTRPSHVRSWDLRRCFDPNCKAAKRHFPTALPATSMKWIFSADAELIKLSAGDGMWRAAWTPPQIDDLSACARVGKRWVPLPT